QELAVELSAKPWLVFTPARYEGIDRRVIDEYATRIPVVEVSIGDYVLAGGEAAVLVITEAVARLLPG
ncbi:tRNA (guanosine(37)-N1)-methyltransferase TrmD, partial [Streptomyces sp. SID8455]|nr:tRNA (guanosine(37)-N1)-methyltransferase TrmD [Streptomyces sp. SID8455]